MGKGRHVVNLDVIHDDNEMGNRPISYQDEFSRIIYATPLYTAHNSGVARKVADHPG